MPYGNELDNVILRSEKGRPLTVEQLDNNFRYLRSFAANLGSSIETDFSLDTNEVFSFGTDGKFSLGTDPSGLSLVVQSNFEEDSGDPVFIVRNNAGQALLEVMPDGGILAPAGAFQIDASQLTGLDLSDFEDLKFGHIEFEPFGSISQLEAALPNQASGTLAFVGGELLIKI
tara:strand:- start:8 stop:526 length:519 start_codon:yes stop_codon:yes gene_type:complete